jgi:hypothetical protein
MLFKFQDLIKKNYAHKIIQQVIDNELKDGILDGEDFLALDNPVYQERILFILGPKEIILGQSSQSNDALRFENKILNSQNTQNRSDAVFVAKEGNKNRVVCIFENKIANSSDNNLINRQINDVLREVIERYLIPYYENYQLLVSEENRNLKKNEKKPIVHISLMFYLPENYLQGKDQLIYYLNSSKKYDASLMLKETGFFCYNLSLSAKDVTLIVDDYKKDKKEAITILKDYYKKQKKSEVFTRKESNNFPFILIMKGNPKRGPWADDNNYSFDCRLPQLYDIPLWNITPDSKINNTRDLNKDNLTKQFAQFSDTFCHNYSQSQKNVSLSEIYIGTGAKAREISYDYYKTVVVPLKTKDYSYDDWTHNMDNEIMYISCDMSSIDGQHSTTTILDILNMLANKSHLMSEEGVGFNEANRIFNKSMKKNNLDKSEKAAIEKFLLENQLIEVNIKGFENPDLAKRNAKNQNNISEQSAFEKLFDNYKPLCKQLAIYFNEEKKQAGIKVYIPITKDAFSLPSFRDVKSTYDPLEMSYFISLGALLHFPIKPQKNSYFSSNTSSSSTHTNWKKALEIYFEKSDFINILYNLLSLRLKYKEDSMTNTSLCNEFISEIKSSIKKASLSALEEQKLQSWKDKITLIKDMIPMVDDDNFIDQQIQTQYLILEEEISNISTLKKERVLFVGNFIYAYMNMSCNLKISLKKVLSADLRFDFYSLVYLMSLLREIHTDIDTLVQTYPDISSFERFFKQLDEYINKEVIEVYGEFNENGEKVIKQSLGIGGGEKETDHEILQKLYEFKG